jgi:hypothetical protein
MVNKKVIIGLGVLAVAGIGYYMWTKNKPENKSEFLGFKTKKRETNSNPTNVVLGGTPVCVTTCEYTNKSNGSVSVWAGGCNPTKANQGWTTITRCSGGGSNTIMNAE